MLIVNSDGTSELDSLIDSLLSYGKLASPSGEIDYTEESLDDLKKLREVKQVWSLDLTALEDFDINRANNIIGGKPFTTEANPWIVDDEGNPLYPLIQLNLEQISNLTGTDFGTGLLQVWININVDGENWKFLRRSLVNSLLSSSNYGKYLSTENKKYPTWKPC